MIPEFLGAVIFDMDGVLVDTEPMYQTVMIEACAAQGYAMDAAFHMRLIGTPKDLGDAMLGAEFGRDFNLPRYHTYCETGMAKRCAQSVPIKPGVRELLSFLAEQKLPTAVATSTARAAALLRLRQAGLGDLLPVVVARDDVERGKPHPDSFLQAASLLGVVPAHCIALEDSYNGVRAAAAAGMATIMVPDLLPSTPEMQSLCLGVVDNLTHLLSCLRVAERS